MTIREAYCASVMISDGRIVRIGESIEDSAKRVINADICIFNPDTIIDKADFVNCTENNEGI